MERVQGGERGEKESSSLAVPTQARGFRLAVINGSSYLHPCPMALTEEASGTMLQNKSIWTIKGNFKVLGSFLNLDIKTIDSNLEKGTEMSLGWLKCFSYLIKSVYSYVLSKGY